MSWTIVKDEEAHNKALELCRGEYQRNFIMGFENLSGSTLKGKAKQWSGKYAKSRAGILARLDKAGIYYTEERGENGRRLLVIGV